MFSNIIDTLLDKMQTPDFWRGMVYALASAGISIKPEYLPAIMMIALGISGVLHIIWTKKHVSHTTN